MSELPNFADGQPTGVKDVDGEHISFGDTVRNLSYYEEFKNDNMCEGYADSTVCMIGGYIHPFVSFYIRGGIEGDIHCARNYVDVSTMTACSFKIIKKLINN